MKWKFNSKLDRVRLPRGLWKWIKLNAATRRPQLRLTNVKVNIFIDLLTFAVFVEHITNLSQLPMDVSNITMNRMALLSLSISKAVHTLAIHVTQFALIDKTTKTQWLRMNWTNRLFPLEYFWQLVYLSDSLKFHFTWTQKMRTIHSISIVWIMLDLLTIILPFRSL